MTRHNDHAPYEYGVQTQKRCMFSLQGPGARKAAYVDSGDMKRTLHFGIEQSLAPPNTQIVRPQGPQGSPGS